MIHLSGRRLFAVHQFLHEIFATADPGQLRLLIPAGLSRLIPCERTSFNELDHKQAPVKVVPNPVPAWWGRLGEAYEAHYRDHPIFNPKHPPALKRTVSFHDPCYAAGWKKSALNHEYFAPLGLNHQLSVVISRQDRVMVGIAANRSRTDFSPHDRALFDLLNPHLALAWKNALAFSALQRQLSKLTDDSPCDQVVVTVDGERARLRPLSRGASQLLRQYFAVDSAGNGLLPGELDQWLRAQRLHLASPTALASPPDRLVIHRRNGRLTVQLARTRPDEAILLLEATGHPAANPVVRVTGLTQRENEILHWLAEGKRNGEIAIILGLSPRTVEKHMENIFGKLGVDTRTGAIRQAREMVQRRHA